jgi:hypothetical protein
LIKILVGQKAVICKLTFWLHDLLSGYLFQLCMHLQNRYKLGIHQPISLKGSLEREDLDKYMLVDVFRLLVSVIGALVQVL